MPRTPEQNGAVERENRTLVETARAMMFGKRKSLPHNLWAELINTAVYVLNRTGPTSVDNKTPYELWYEKKPGVKHLRVIGSDCYVHIDKRFRKKFDKKAIKGVLIGYDNDDGYRIWCQNKLILSRDVIFHESTCGLGNNQSNLIPLPEEEENVQNVQPTSESDSEKEQKPCLRDRNKLRKPIYKDYSSESDSEKEQKPCLRDRNKLRKPIYKDYSSGSDDEEQQKGCLHNENQLENSSCKDRCTLEDNEQERKQFYHRDQLKESPNFDDRICMLQLCSGEPDTYEEAVKCKDHKHWIKAMNDEMSSLIKNQTWELTDLPNDAKVIPCKWVFKLKMNPDGSVEKYKARLVAKGFNQRKGVDYNQTFSPVARLCTIRSVLSIAASKRMFLKQFDVSTAFLYGELDESVYVQQPEGYNNGSSKVCKLMKSLYGLKQAPRCWNKRIERFLVQQGFKISEADPCLYVRSRGDKVLLLALYVDDGLLAATDMQDLDLFISKIEAEFEIKVKVASYFLGIEIKRMEDGSLKINQPAYVKRVLERFRFDSCKVVATPMIKTDEKVESGKVEVNFPYRQAVGALMFLMTATRPDLAYSVGYLSRVLDKPSTEDIVKVKRVFRYLAGTIKKGIVYKPDCKPEELECYSDADFGGCTTTRRSTSGVVILYAGGAISWLSQKQVVVATSTTESEIVAATEATKEIVWLKRLFSDVIKLRQTPILQVDNSAAVKLAQNPEFHRRTKHIDLKYFFVREKVVDRSIEIKQISTECQVADVMTKPLDRVRFNNMCERMGLV